MRKSSKIALQARIACEKWRSHFRENIEEYHRMHEFILSQQWTQDEQDEMIQTYRKVPMTSNKLGVMANTLMGEQQQNTPQLQVMPMDSATSEVAHIRELIVKDIMFSTNSRQHVQIAAKQAIIGGYSALMVDTEYTHDKGFEQNIVYRSFKDATRAFFDIGAEQEDKTDGMCCGVLWRLTREKFRNMYGEDAEEKIGNMTASRQEIALATEPLRPGDSDDAFNWSDDDGITVMDYYLRKPEKDTLYRLSNGRNITQDEMDRIIESSKARAMRERDESAMQNIMESMQQEPMQQPEMVQNPMSMGMNPANPMAMDDIGDSQSTVSPLPEQPMPEMRMEDAANDDYITLYDDGRPVRIEETREIKRYRIVHYRIAGDYVLDKSEFPAQHLPIVFMDLNSWFDKNGKQVTRSFFQDVKDTQRYINYLRTQSAYILKVSRYDQWVGSKKNVSGNDTRQIWTNPSNTQGMLFFDESPTGVTPQQVRPPEISQSLFSQYQLAIEDLYTSTGLYPSRMGEQGNEVSGAAIDARTRQGSYSTFSVFTAINRAYAATGVIVNELIPHVYDSERTITLMTPNEGIKNIVINRQADEYGELVENDIRKGSWQVRLIPGPSFEGQKQQALESLQMVLQNNPQTFNMIADLYADNLPLANSIEIRNRLKTLVPPELIEAGKTGEAPQQQGPNPEQQAMQMQSQMMQMEAMLKQKEIEIKEQEIMLKQQQMQAEIEIEMQRLEAEKLEAAAKLEEQRLRYLAETDRTQSDNAIAHADNLTKILTHRMDFRHDNRNG